MLKKCNFKTFQSTTQIVLKEICMPMNMQNKSALEIILLDVYDKYCLIVMKQMSL